MNTDLSPQLHTTERESKRVLFVNPGKKDRFGVGSIHQGLSLLAEILVTQGYAVKLIDYAFLSNVQHPIHIPSIEEVIREYQPQVIGISVFTYLYDECQHLIERISCCCKAPIILGGPHISIFPEDFGADPRISYIVRGEAETVIASLIATAQTQPRPMLIDAPLPSPESIPAANLDVADGSQYLQEYRIQLSRGCPYHCNFCNIQLVAGRRIRARDIEQCLNEIVEAKKQFPNINTVNISDDCPTFDMERFKRFLRMFKDANIKCALAIDNVRANLIDEELIRLYAEAGGTNICIGVESTHPEVFALIHKGESFEAIVYAAKLVRQYGLKLGFCFVIGLPGDTLERHRTHSMRFAAEFKPDYCFWNMCIPWPGTDIYQWYQAHGEIGDMRNFSTLIDPYLNFQEPVASSEDFAKEDRIKAWLMANMETHCYFSPRAIAKLAVLTCRYHLYRSFEIYLFTCFYPKLMSYLKKWLRKVTHKQSFSGNR